MPFARLLFLLLFFSSGLSDAAAQERPNVILIMTDDQGYGDLGYHGNPVIQTPVLDGLAAEAVRFANFYVSPVCAPTRSSLLTGRYSLRTGVRDTYNGGAIMSGEEVTLAEILGAAGYRTGIFGKWHLGDNYPARPGDQGFEENLIHLGGGIGQPGDFLNYFEGDSSYFNPTLWRNDVPEPSTGYCSDVFTDAAIDFVDREDDRPFFCYLAFNAPHTPLQTRAEDLALYADVPDGAFTIGTPAEDRAMDVKSIADARKVYAMISNIDANVGRLLDRLDRMGASDNTIVIFMSDNGPQQYRYKRGLRGSKTTVWEGGIRTPFFFRYPARFAGDVTVEGTAAHIDVIPTLAELCGADLPTDRKIDGRSLVPHLSGDVPLPDDRLLFVNWSRKYPVPYQNMALFRGSEKLVAHADYGSDDGLKIYDVATDPSESDDRSATDPDRRAALFSALEDTYEEIIREPAIRGPVPIVIDTTKESPVYLNRNDVGGDRQIWLQEEAFGVWSLDVRTPGLFDITYRFMEPVGPGGTAYLELGPRIYTSSAFPGGTEVTLKGVRLPEGPVSLIPFYRLSQHERILPLYVKLTPVADRVGQ